MAADVLGVIGPEVSGPDVSTADLGEMGGVGSDFRRFRYAET